MKLPETLDKSHIRILDVDDEQGMRDMISLELSSQGYQVVTATNGLEALEKIKTQRFDLVITDLKMPQMDGLTLLENIKKTNPKIEVILATGHGTVESAVAAMKNGAYDFILKPFNLEELNALIEKVLEKKELKTLVALHEASHAVFSTMKLDDLLEVIMDLLQKMLGADEGSIMLLGEDKKLKIATSRGLPEEVRQVQLEIGERIAGMVAQEKRGRLFVNGLEKYPEFKGISTNSRIRSSIVCPLVVQNEVLGVLNMNRIGASDNFTFSDLQSTLILSAQIGLAIQNAKLYSTLQGAYQKLEKAQGQLIQSEKLASIGRLVAGIAHELNNPLAAVIGYSELISGMKKIEDIQQYVPVIFAQAQRCSNIVRGLLLFARRQKPTLQPVDLCLLIDSGLDALSLEFKQRGIKVVRNFPKETISLQADPDLLGQVVGNILTNAYQALDEVSWERVIEIKVQKTEENAALSFKDSGPGIPKENLHKIFDPFYTTKEVGIGTGLGLSLSYGIVREHGGAISVQSEPKKGALFTIELPLQVKENLNLPSPTVAFVRPQPVRLGLSPDARTLLVEDEKPIQGLISKIFTEQNCQLDIASDGQDALEKLEAGHYDLILCDYRMPRIDGMKFYEQLKTTRPELAGHFLFITGSTEFARGFGPSSDKQLPPCLLKPFTKAELISAVNGVLANGKCKKV